MENTESDSNLKARTIGAFVWKFLERVGNQAIMLVVQIVMARLLTPADFGSLAIMMVLMNIGNVMVQSGLNTALVQMNDVTDRDYSTVFWLSGSLSLIFYVAIWACSPAIASFYGMPEVVWPLRVLALILLLGVANSILVAIVTKQLRLKLTFVSTIASVVVSGCVGVGLAMVGTGVWALVAQQLLYQLVGCICLFASVKWRPAAVFDVSRAKAMLSFGWKILVAGLIEMAYDSLDELIVGKRFGSNELGFLSQGKRMPRALGSALDGAIQPVVLSATSLIQEDKAYVRRLLKRSVSVSSYLVCPCMLFLAIAAAPLISLLLGEQWLPCVFFMQVYCVINSLNPICTSSGQVFNGLGMSGLYLGLQLLKKLVGACFIFGSTAFWHFGGCCSGCIVRHCFRLFEQYGS